MVALRYLFRRCPLCVITPVPLIFVWHWVYLWFLTALFIANWLPVTLLVETTETTTPASIPGGVNPFDPIEGGRRKRQIQLKLSTPPQQYVHSTETTIPEFLSLPNAPGSESSPARLSPSNTLTTNDPHHRPGVDTTLAPPGDNLLFVPIEAS